MEQLHPNVSTHNTNNTRTQQTKQNHECSHVCMPCACVLNTHTFAFACMYDQHEFVRPIRDLHTCPLHQNVMCIHIHTYACAHAHIYTCIVWLQIRMCGICVCPIMFDLTIDTCFPIHVENQTNINTHEQHRFESQNYHVGVWQSGVNPFLCNMCFLHEQFCLRSFQWFMIGQFGSEAVPIVIWMTWVKRSKSNDRL